MKRREIDALTDRYSREPEPEPEPKPAVVKWFNLRVPNSYGSVVHRAIGPWLTACGLDGRAALVSTGEATTCKRCLKYDVAAVGGELRTVLSTASDASGR